ncbi:MAG: hypothetical protein SPJ28_02410 [Oscillospiraceae bacterium]|nr:hypothetical protein [Oscillospiraceae bacterium]
MTKRFQAPCGQKERPVKQLPVNKNNINKNGNANGGSLLFRRGAELHGQILPCISSTIGYLMAPQKASWNFQQEKRRESRNFVWIAVKKVKFF